MEGERKRQLLSEGERLEKCQVKSDKSLNLKETATALRWLLKGREHTKLSEGRFKPFSVFFAVVDAYDLKKKNHVLFYLSSWLREENGMTS